MREIQNHHWNATVTVVGKIQQWMPKLVGRPLRRIFYVSSYYKSLEESYS